MTSLRVFLTAIAAVAVVPIVLFGLLWFSCHLAALVWRERSHGGRCRVCGCTDEDCSQCIAFVGAPCSWIDEDHTICSRCVDALATNDLALDDLSPDCSPLNAVRRL